MRFALVTVVSVLSLWSAMDVHASSTDPGIGIIVEEIEQKDKETIEVWSEELDLLAQITEAEAGNQDEKGKRLVVDVILNRVENPEFPNTIQDVIFEKGQFSCIKDGNFDLAAKHISESTYEAVRKEVYEGRIDYGILYFGRRKVNGKGFWKYEDHWFSY